MSHKNKQKKRLTTPKKSKIFANPKRRIVSRTNPLIELAKHPPLCARAACWTRLYNAATPFDSRDRRAQLATAHRDMLEILVTDFGMSFDEFEVMRHEDCPYWNFDKGNNCPLLTCSELESACFYYKCGMYVDLVDEDEEDMQGLEFLYCKPE